MSDSPLIEDLAGGQDYPPGTLYLIATPIGNLADITLRALACLARVDLVAAEDTRHARKLLAQYGLSRPTLALHQHNEKSGAQEIVARLAAGARVAYVSDAGTPGISDPGALLVDAVLGAGLRVMPLPGASAAICAVSAAGLADGPFHFVGFLPSRRGQARHVLDGLAALDAHLVFYEAPHRVAATLELLAAVFGPERRVVIARELTKRHEQIARMTLAESLEFIGADEDRQRGEFVLIVEAAGPAREDEARALAVLKRLLDVLPLSEAVALAAELTGASRKLLYQQALLLRRDPS